MSARVRADCVVHELMQHRMTRRSPLLDELYRQWSALRGDGPPPRIEDVEAGDLRFIESHAMVLDRLGPGAVRLRGGGRVVAALLGTEPRGLPARALFRAVGRTEVMDALDQTFTRPAIVTLDLLDDAPGEAAPLSAQMLVVPMRGRSGAVDKALACLALRGPVGMRPRRFRLEARQVAPLAPPRRSAPPRPLVAAGGGGLRLVT